MASAQLPKFSFQFFKEVLKDTFNAWLDVNAPRLGAALSYYSIFSLGPLLIITIAVAGFFFGEEAASGQIFQQLRGIVGNAGAQSIQALVAGASKPAAGTTATILSVLTLLIGATGVVIQLKDALNTIWMVKAKPGHTLRIFFRKYFMSLTALLGLGFILVASLLFSTVLHVIGDYFSHFLPFSESLLSILNGLFSFLLITGLFALMYKMLPDVRLQWADVWVGALGTSIFFLLGKSLVALYLGKQSFDSSYGAASSVVVLLVWIYYLSQVFFFGAEFTRIFTLRKGRRIEPSPDAEYEEKAHEAPGLQKSVTAP